MELDSDDDTFVTIGTALDPYLEDEVPKRPVPIQDQTVKDSRGRTRFHGAFTGGFSAGYFNSVGSKEGFVPGLFVSSREKKHEASTQKPEDFMDDEDFGEHGIAPKVVTATEQFTSSQRKRRDDHANLDMLTDMVVPLNDSMGFKLLRHLGWREGQGIGPRVTRKQKRNIAKVYGCALPGSENDESSEDEFLPQDVTFAPKDVNPIKFNPKDNMHGLGYSGINMNRSRNEPSAGGHINLFEPNPIEATAGIRSKKKGRGNKIGMRGQAFGVGEYEDEDDIDVYARDSMDNYDIELGGQSGDKSFGWTAPKHKGLSAAPIGYIGKVLEGFKLSTNTLKPKKHYPPPDLPKNFKPFHVRPSEKVYEQQSTKVDRKSMNANVRKNMLGEIGSVFNLVSSADKAQMESAKQLQKVKVEPTDHQRNNTSDPKPSKSVKTTRFEPSSSNMDSSSGQTSSSVPLTGSKPQPLYKGTPVFKPFAKDPAKQARYEKYLETMKKDKKYRSGDIPEGSMTEWERNKELKEFARAAQLYKPMSSVMASRFTTAKYDDNDKTVEIPPDEVTDKSDQKKAVEMKMFGKLTRERYDWHPDRVLCKRFNVANPYPESTIVGVPKVKRDKYSVFNFLNDPTAGIVDDDDRHREEEQDLPQRKQRTEDRPEESLNTSHTDVNVRPLAILAQDDNENTMTQHHSSDMQSVTTEPEVGVESQGGETKERPTMDIFKAIFSDSDSSSSESEKDDENDEDDNKISSQQTENTSIEHNKNTAGTIPIETLSERLSGEKHETPPTAQKHIFCLPNKKRDGETRNNADFSKNSQNDSNREVSVHEESSELGSLPQPPGESSNTMNTDEIPEGAVWMERVVESSATSKKHKKHKHKKKKSSHKSKKHKKDKKSSKKKKKKEKKSKQEVIVVSSSSSSGSDADNSDSESDTDAKIRDRIRKLTEQKRRPTAADFM